MSPRSSAEEQAAVTYIQDGGFTSFADHTIKLSVNKTKWTGFVSLDPFFYSLAFDLNIWSNSKAIGSKKHFLLEKEKH